MSSSRIATVQTFVQSFGKLDLDTIQTLVSPSFLYTFAPSSASIPPPMDYNTWAGRMGQVRALLEAYPITIIKIIDCGDTENKVVIHATGQAQFKDQVTDVGLPKEEWVNNGEYVIIFTMNGDAKLDAIFEFADSKSVDRFVGLMQRAGGNLQRQFGKQ
jgi:hypothetical protein